MNSKNLNGSDAELRASESQNFEPFQNFSISKFRSDLDPLLGLISTRGPFGGYTIHDIRHIDKLLGSLEWLIHEETKRHMTPTDWLMIVLSCYLHDFGMVVADDELEHINQSGIEEFVEEIIANNEEGSDFYERLSAFSPEDKQQFLYEEFVRYYHAERIYYWIKGECHPKFPNASKIKDALSDLLIALPEQFRDDLALACMSHHEDDLENFEKYITRRAYGQSDDSVCNVHFACLVLRLADILHLTSDRSPSVMFRAINPTDPMSYVEWTKHMGVSRVAPPPTAENNDREKLEKNGIPIEVHAFYNNAEPFFSLSHFLDYVEREIEKVFQWSFLAREEKSSDLSLYWRRINRDNIQTKGFETRQYSFNLNQKKILTLLTGHMLYNDASVVVRELVQNSIDAVKLQKKLNTNQSYDGEVSVLWNSDEKKLIVTDNGTGMTQTQLEDYFLSVGSSRYSDDNFIEEHPDFNAISRFGIGILSCFMVADEVNVYTFSEEEDTGKHLELRSLHGQYVVKLLNRNSETKLEKIDAHGTRIELSFRPSVKTDDIREYFAKWILLPEVPVSYHENNEYVETSAKTTAECLENAISAKINLEGRNDLRIFTIEKDGVEISFLCEYNKYFDQWSIVTKDDAAHDADDNDNFGSICVEGIHVEKTKSLFFRSTPRLVANFYGKNSPKTNVARSGLEQNRLSEIELEILNGLCGHINDQLDNLSNNNKRSVSWIAFEGEFAVNTIRTLSFSSQMRKATDSVRKHIIDANGERKRVSAENLNELDGLWTVSSLFFDRAESLLRESSSNATLNDLMRVVYPDAQPLPADCIFSLSGDYIDQYDGQLAAGLYGKLPSKLILDESSRRVDILWETYTEDSEPTFAMSAAALTEKGFKTIPDFSYRLNPRLYESQNVWLANNNLYTEKWRDDIAIRDRGVILLPPSGKHYELIEKLIEATNSADSKKSLISSSKLSMFQEALRFERGSDTEEIITYLLESRLRGISTNMDEYRTKEFSELIDIAVKMEVFSPRAWSRGKEE